METLTTTIQREPLREIIAGRKTVEYREIKPYWTQRLARRKCPFLLRLINGMAKANPEVTVRVDRIRRNGTAGVYELHIDAVVSYKNWDKRREAPPKLRSPRNVANHSIERTAHSRLRRLRSTAHVEH